MPKTLLKDYQNISNIIWIISNTFMLMFGIFILLDNAFGMQTLLENKDQVEALFILIGASGLITQIGGYRRMMNRLDDSSKEELDKDKSVQWFKKNEIKALTAVGVVEWAYMYIVTMQLSDEMQALMFVISILMLTVVNTIHTYVVGMITFSYEREQSRFNGEGRWKQQKSQ